MAAMLRIPLPLAVAPQEEEVFQQVAERECNKEKELVLSVSEGLISAPAKEQLNKLLDLRAEVIINTFAEAYEIHLAKEIVKRLKDSLIEVPEFLDGPVLTELLTKDELWKLTVYIERDSQLGAAFAEGAGIIAYRRIESIPKIRSRAARIRFATHVRSQMAIIKQNTWREHASKR